MLVNINNVGWVFIGLQFCMYFVSMMASQFSQEIGCWKKEKILGSGGFAYVALWKNKETNDTIALKECRWGHDPMMTPKHRSRWKQEIEILSQLNHPNIVRAIVVPPELDVPSTELPLLAMEYCAYGDLRKLLSKPENCCGLKEKHVRVIMRDISSAVNYLHSQQMVIIHRDLKPENIVIQYQNGKVLYKLIDLGYAKVIDQGSLCSSFVGTLQYIAPELFMGQKYTYTVDYWSLGLVTHEIITGTRPFLPDKSPPEWIPIIKQKDLTQIRAFLDKDKNIVFSSEISPFHYISKSFKQDVEQWLQLMLNYDPEKRGSSGGISFLIHLENILQKKIVLIFCIKTLSLHSLTVSEELTYEEFSKLLEKETKINVSQQEIILPNGKIPDSNRGVEQFINNMEEDESLIFLFDTEDLSIPTLNSSSVYISPDVKCMMRNPHMKIDYMRQRSVWSEAIHLCQQEYIHINRVLQSFQASVKKLYNNATIARKNISHMNDEMKKLLAKCSFFKCSLERDIAFYKKQNLKKNFNSPRLLDEWRKNLENVNKIDLLAKKVSSLEECSSKLIAQVIDLYKKPHTKLKKATPNEEVYRKILELFSELKRQKERKKSFQDNVDYVKQLCLFLQHSHNIMQELLQLICKVRLVKHNLVECQPSIIDLPFEIAEWDAQIENWQSQRQKEMWNLIDRLNNVVLSSKDNTQFKCQPILLNKCFDTAEENIRTSCNTVPIDLQTSQETSTQPCSSIKGSSVAMQSISQSKNDTPQTSTPNKNFCDKFNSDSINLSSNLSFSSILDQASKENQRVKKENQNLFESFQSMLGQLQTFKGPTAPYHSKN